ncbi:MAG TPA: hypothetical protein DCG41_03940 [Verrucomicrobiales bacterium]|nr:hypothetical protein [Verrucomicrobiales bacterium]
MPRQDCGTLNPREMGYSQLFFPQTGHLFNSQAILLCLKGSSPCSRNNVQNPPKVPNKREHFRLKQSFIKHFKILLI